MSKKPTLEEYLNHKLAKSSAENYLFTINHFLKMNPKAKRYRYVDLVNWLAETRKQYPNIQTSIRILSSIKQYYDYLVWTEQRNDNPSQTLTVKRGGNHTIQLQDLFTSSELEQLLNRENRYTDLLNRNKVLISFMIYQALTSQEVIQLNIDSVDLDLGIVTVKHNGKLKRELKLKPNQILLLDRYIHQTRPKMLRGNTSKLILNKLGKPISVDGINSVFNQLALLFPEKKLNPQTIRMSVISNWVNEKRIPLETVQQWAGHKWPSSTEKYRRTDSNEQRKLINQFFPI